MSSKIEQLIDDIEEYIDSCKSQTFSKGNIIVAKDDIDDLLRALRAKTPEEIKYYQKIISNKEAILNDARLKAEELINKATIQTNELISEHEIMQQAYSQANEVVSMATQQAQDILDNAILEANAVRLAAMEYTDRLLEELENIISYSISTVGDRNEKLMLSLTDCAEIVSANRAELNPQPEEEQTSMSQEFSDEVELDIM